MPGKSFLSSMLMWQRACDRVCCMSFTAQSVPFPNPEKQSKLGFTFLSGVASVQTVKTHCVTSHGGFLHLCLQNSAT
jgi:hypothetical protein